jgi:hypothetical protein
LKKEKNVVEKFSQRRTAIRLSEPNLQKQFALRAEDACRQNEKIARTRLLKKKPEKNQSGDSAKAEASALVPCFGWSSARAFEARRVRGATFS